MTLERTSQSDNSSAASQAVIDFLNSLNVIKSDDVIDPSWIDRYIEESLASGVHTVSEEEFFNHLLSIARGGKKL